MHLRVVAFHIKPESLDVFEPATADHARASRDEEGVLRFELWRQADDPARFALVIAFVDEAARERHFASERYRRWRETVESTFAEPLHGVKYLPAAVGSSL